MTTPTPEARRAEIAERHDAHKSLIAKKRLAGGPSYDDWVVFTHMAIDDREWLLVELSRLTAQVEAQDEKIKGYLYMLEVDQRVVAEKDGEIERLTAQVEGMRLGISNYLDEFDAPVKDYSMVRIRREQLRSLAARPGVEKEETENG
jgi:hypothetical protein